MPDVENQSIVCNLYSDFLKWPLPPKVKIVHQFYPAAVCPKHRFKFNVDHCCCCSSADESVEHLLVSCPVTQHVLLEIKNWLSFRLNDLPALTTMHILFLMDNLSPSISDIINIVILLAKYHIH